MKNFQQTVKVICVQYEPKYKNIKANIKQLEEMFQGYSEKDEIDIVVFPEMTLSGYVFDDLNDIKPYTSYYDKGEQFEFISNLAKKLKCYCFMGYPEKTYDNKYYNSSFIITPEGVSLPSYRKHFLFEDDERWSLEGDKFGYMEIISKKGLKLKLGIGICMDINNYQFKSPWNNMEFATHCIQHDVDIIIFLTNWTDQSPNNLTEENRYELWEYWLSRMKPYSDRNKKNKYTGKNVYFLAADRTGHEKTTDFYGCSCVLKLSPKPVIINSCGKRDKKLLETILKF